MKGTTCIPRVISLVAGVPLFIAFAWIALGSAQTADAAASPVPSTASLIAYAQQQAQANGIDPTIFVKQINQESGFNPNATSAAGAIGIAQIVTTYHPGVNALDPFASLAFAAQLDAQYLRQFSGRYDLMLAAYNAGPDAVAACTCVPAITQTQQYVQDILSGTSIPPVPASTGSGTMSPTPSASPTATPTPSASTPEPGRAPGAAAPLPSTTPTGGTTNRPSRTHHHASEPPSAASPLSSGSQGASSSASAGDPRMGDGRWAEVGQQLTGTPSPTPGQQVSPQLARSP